MAVHEKAIVLLSGGLDSTVSLAWAVREFSVVRAIFVAYGQKALRAEANAAGEIARRYNVEVLHVELPFFAQICRRYETVSAHKCEGSSQLPPDTTEELLSLWVPNRNMVFASIAAAFGESLGCEVVVTGFNAEEGEQFPDNTQEFVTRMNSALELSTLSSVRLVCPLIDLDKVGILKMGIALKAPLELIYSCYEGNEMMCGECMSCLRLKKAISELFASEGLTAEFKAQINRRFLK
ncbi:MAG: 7-cyano-7-deazaguanine synthase QueC [Candidatus Coatesbacteria bacterium]|nr:MAG: 7-cyano-7-deazaguanine synthase QueC [Candidatus Coatesbacteria bacterium]